MLLLGGGIIGDGTLELLTGQEEGREVPQSSCSGAIEHTVEEVVLEAGSCEGPKMLLGQSGQEVSSLRRQGWQGESWVKGCMPLKER